MGTIDPLFYKLKSGTLQIIQNIFYQHNSFKNVFLFKNLIALNLYVSIYS